MLIRRHLFAALLAGSGIASGLAGCASSPPQPSVSWPPSAMPALPQPSYAGASAAGFVPTTRAEAEQQRTAALFADAQRRGIFDRQAALTDAPQRPLSLPTPVLPADAQPGDCYGLVETPAQTRSSQQAYGVRPAYERLEYVPPRYVSSAQSTVVSGSERLVIMPPIGTQAGVVQRSVQAPQQIAATVYQQVDSGGYARVVVPAEAVTVSVDEIVQPATRQWQRMSCSELRGRKLNRAEVRLLQDALRARGFDPGPTDGVIGKYTHRALDAYQRAQGLPQEPQLNPQTLASLGLKA